MYEHKENSGSIFQNDKEGKEARPDYTGTAKVDGVDYRIASWINNTKDGKENLSLKFALQ